MLGHGITISFSFLLIWVSASSSCAVSSASTTIIAGSACAMIPAIVSVSSPGVYGIQYSPCHRDGERNSTISGVLKARTLTTSPRLIPDFFTAEAKRQQRVDLGPRLVFPL